MLNKVKVLLRVEFSAAKEIGRKRRTGIRKKREKEEVERIR